jgi:carboxymethylenebutenolidase
MTTYHSWVSIDTPDGPMPMYLAVPGGGDPRPSVLVIHGIDGLSGETTNVADEIAEEGYVAAAPDLFHRGPICSTFEDQFKRRRAHRDSQYTMDLSAGLDYLQTQPLVRPGPTGIIGFCMGGRVSYFMAATDPRIAVAIDCYGGGVLVSEGGPPPIELTSGIHCPMLILDGEKDHNPTPADLKLILAALEEHDVQHEVHVYPDVGHGFMGEAHLTPAREDAFKQAWAFLHKHLETPPNDYVEKKIAPPTR